MEKEVTIAITHESDIVEARRVGRLLAGELGMASTDAVLVATAISEVARNILSYASRGELILEKVHSGSTSGIRVTARDKGPGIPDIELALQDGYSTGKSLGLGLPGAKRLMDEFTIESQVGEGTTVRMVKWMPRRR